MTPIGNQGGRSDPLADTDSEYCDCFVADETDDSGSEDPPQIMQWLRIEEPVD